MELIKNLKEVSLIKNLSLAILGTMLLASIGKNKNTFLAGTYDYANFCGSSIGCCIRMEAWSIYSIAIFT